MNFSYYTKEAKPIRIILRFDLASLHFTLKSKVSINKYRDFLAIKGNAGDA